MDRPPLIFSSTVWNLLTRQKTFGAIPTCSLNNSMKRRELKPVLSTTSAILAVAGLARNFPTAYSTTGSPSNVPVVQFVAGKFQKGQRAGRTKRHAHDASLFIGVDRKTYCVRTADAAPAEFSNLFRIVRVVQARFILQQINDQGDAAVRH